MRLTELDPEWLTLADTPGTRRRGEATDVASAQGVIFLCPTCFRKNAGPVGTHSVLVWFRDRGVPDEEQPGPGRWTATGSSFEDLTLHPSVNIATAERPDEWHGWVQGGEVT